MKKQLGDTQRQGMTGGIYFDYYGVVVDLDNLLAFCEYAL